MKELQNLYEKINPKASPENMAANIISASAEKTSGRRARFSWKKPVAVAAALSCAAALTVTVSAAGGFGVLLERLFGNSEIALDMEQRSVFHDEDGDVSVDIDELISDGMCTYAAIRYTALSDAGADWLGSADILYNSSPVPPERSEGEKLPSLRELYDGRLEIAPRGFFDDLSEWTMDNGMLNYYEWKQTHYEGNWGGHREEITEEGDALSRSFMITIELNKRDTAGDEVAFLYPMTNETRLASVNVGEFTKERIIVIDFEFDADKYYVPRCLRVSQLSATLYGNFTERKHGEWTYRGIGNPLDVSLDAYRSFYRNTYLVLNDGTKLYFEPEGRPVGVLSEDTSYAKYVLLSSTFRSKSGSFADEHITIDPDDVVGIQIEDKYYSFVE